MKVSTALLDASRDEPLKALTMDNIWSRSTLAPPPSVLGPGTWVYGASMALGRRVLASNPRVNLFHLGFKACDSYTRAEAAIAAVACPVLFVLGSQDQMTQPRAAQSLIARAREGGRRAEVVYLPVGHRQMSEAPDATLFALRDFLKA
jgi:pimeloyl-ACP methyl ester carboxylesterase